MNNPRRRRSTRARPTHLRLCEGPQERQSSLMATAITWAGARSALRRFLAWVNWFLGA